MRFTRLKIGQNETKQLTVKNGINEPSIIGTVANPFSFVSLEEITGEFPASSTIYFRENYVLQNESGEFATTDQGYGVAGFTDESKKFTLYSYEISFNEIDLTAGEEGDITGEHAGGEGSFLNVYSRTSEQGEAPAGEWTLFDEDVEVQSDKTWTATGIIATAGTHDFKAVDSVCSACQAQLDDVVVASGVFAFQFGGSGDDYLTKIEKIGTDYYIAGATNSDTIFGENTGYSSGWVLFLCKLNSSGEKQWIIFGTTSTSRSQIPYDNMAYDPVTEKIYWVSDCVYSSFADYGVNPYNAVKRVALDGTVEATHSSTTNNSMFCSLCTDGVKVYIHRYAYPNSVYVREIPCNFTTGTTGNTDRAFTVTAGQSDAYIINNKLIQDGNYLYESVRGTSPERGYVAKKDKLSHIITSITSNYMFLQIAQSSTRLCVITHDGTNFQIKMFAKSDLSILYTQNIDTNTASMTNGDMSFDGTNFVMTRVSLDGSKYTKYTISDADEYNATTKDITPQSGTIIIAKSGSASGLTCGAIDGKLVADSTDVGGTDCYIYYEE